MGRSASSRNLIPLLGVRPYYLQEKDKNWKFQVEYEEGEREDGDPDFVVETTINLTLEEPEHIYLVDHAWTFQVSVQMADSKKIPPLRCFLGCNCPTTAG